ncbi:MAG: glycosyltransferase [Methanoregulaceae archaeon]|nr:glycosyltransferase [Methanoregulaceae archaeon]
MRVTHVVRFDAGLYYGGGEIQAERTGQALRDLGVEVVPFSPTQREFGDLVHFFGNFDYFDDVASRLRAARIPYVVSPIFVSPRTEGRLKWRRTRQSMLGHYPKRIASLLAGARCLYTLTEHEERNLKAYFGSDLPEMVRIPNGVEDRFSEGDPIAFRSRFRIEPPFAIHVGTLDASKNQLASIAACGSDIQLVIMGRENNAAYVEKCRAAAGPNVHILGSFPHSDPVLADALAAASVFVLPSYRELFPLSALEATVAGCHLVLSDRWGGEAIWGSDAAYVSPDDPAAIRQAIEERISLPKRTRDEVEPYRFQYSWPRVAERILSTYHMALR